MPMLLPPLPALRQFEAAARHQSFMKAAEELGQTASAVSHGINALEKWLGAELFQRGVKGVSLTTAGTHFLPYVTEGLSTILLGAQRLPERRLERQVMLSTTPTFAQRFLIPKLARFRKLYPGIRLSIDSSHRQRHFPLDGFDLSIRTGRGVWQNGGRSELLFNERLLPVASREYLASLKRSGEIDWSSATLLKLSSVEQDWAAWAKSARVDLNFADEMYFDTMQLACEAAIAGLGIAIGRLPLIQPELSSNRLVPVIEPAVKIECGYWLVSAEGQEPRTAINTFRSWLMDETQGFRIARDLVLS